MEECNIVLPEYLSQTSVLPLLWDPDPMMSEWVARVPWRELYWVHKLVASAKVTDVTTPAWHDLIGDRPDDGREQLTNFQVAFEFLFGFHMDLVSAAVDERLRKAAPPGLGEGIARLIAEHVGASQFKGSLRVFYRRNKERWWVQDGEISILHRCSRRDGWAELSTYGGDIEGDERGEDYVYDIGTGTEPSPSHVRSPLRFTTSQARRWPEDNSILVDYAQRGPLHARDSE